MSSDSRSSRSKRRRTNEGREEGGLIDFESCRSKLSKIFFTERDLISRGSEEYEDFWKFLRKYQGFQRTRPRGKDSRPVQSVPFKLLPRDPKDLLNRIPYQDPDDRPFVTEKMLEEFQDILTLFLDYLQKEKLKKLKSLRASQAGLPITAYRSDILKALSERQVIVIAGDTGCGKSTQVPQYLMGAGYGKIACTQPRRLACIALANRVSYETLGLFGSQVGYQIRFERKRSDRTRILFITEGLLLRQVHSDPRLSAYDVIILDEVHERHLSGDFLLGVLKCLLRSRPDLKVILMSATINIDLFKQYFTSEDAPVISVPGRLYPIELKYFPIPDIEQGDGNLNPGPYIRILRLIDKTISTEERGDVLIFLSGHKEIQIICGAAESYSEKTGGHWIVLPLHSSLSLSDQDKVFSSCQPGSRKCIVSTNISETSITIDGIRFVIDSGKMKEMTYDPYCKMRRLKEFWISHASAEQRKGRAGRTGPGTCFRLYAEKEFEALSKFSAPEIQRVHLDSLVLSMISMGLPDVRKFPFIEPPHPETLENAILTLREQDAMNADESLSFLGSHLANLPVDVSIGKMLILGTLFYQVESVLSLAGALSVQSPFTNDAYQNPNCLAARRNLDSEHGDPITLLNAYREWLSVKSRHSENSRKWCKTRGLEEQRFYELTKLRNQFKDILREAELLPKDEEDERLDSSERAARHGELRHLRTMKREWHRSENANKSKRVLKAQKYHIDSNEEDDSLDIKDIEFRMKHDNKKVRELMEGTKAYSYKDLTILKLILTAGLYPQFAIGDEFNNLKGSGTDQLFHTKVKPFNTLHPNSNFASNPEYITVEGLDIISVPGLPSKYPVSSKHQILIYLSLLETTKSYIMSPLRMPALQSLLLFSKTLDTDSQFSRMTFDSWIDLSFVNRHAAQNLVLRAYELRKSLKSLLKEKLQKESATGDKTSKLRDKGHILGEELVEFLHEETPFSMRRLLPGDLKVLYTHKPSQLTLEAVNPFGDDFRPNTDKGGLFLCEGLTYDCIDSGPIIESAAKCPYCESEGFGEEDALKRMSHLKACWNTSMSKKHEEINSMRQEGSKKGVDYFCETCSKSLRLSYTEILRHKQKHNAKE